MTIRALSGECQQWWPASVRRRVLELVPAGVSVAVREDVMLARIEVGLSESWWRQLARPLALVESRGRVLARVSCELADAPAGFLVRVRWQ